ncbi:hypothetical protein QYE76_028062 [Lolium multiflorum]|uniref:DUF4220 domain-containing protein n=1 Tax=Lolium multiflorum TaxID=4521 RepID=A0AAD8QLY0_LOLMU|nr:hypothetical protein QYE76_028062 [Lolium multiflorum]
MSAAEPSPPTDYEPCSLDGILDLALITALIIVGVLAMFLLHVLGTLRRRSSDKLLHAVVLGVYTLSYMVVSYTLGLMQRSACYSAEFPVWAVCLLMLLGGTDNLMACNVDEIDNWKSFHVRHLVKAGLVIYIESAYGDHVPPGYKIPLWAILVVNILQSFVRIKSMKMASKSHQASQTVKPIADYMEHEKQLQLAFGSERPNPTTMKGYRYVVAGEHRLEKYLKQLEDVDDEQRDRKKKLVKFTTVEQIYGCKGRLLGSETDLRLKDLCLSMALAKMLNRRFSGLKLAEADLEETKDLVFKGLLGEDKRHERAFRVIEVELGFLYDLYYTRYPYLYHRSSYLAFCLPLLMVSFCSWLTYELFKEKQRHEPGSNVPLDTTLFLMFVVTFLEAFQLCLHMTSGWFKVALILSYVNNRGLQNIIACFPHRIIGFLLRLEVLRPWAHRLGQYSLLQNCKSKRRPINCLHYVTLFLVNKAKKGRKRGKLAKLSEQLKQAVVDSLVESNGHLTNGVRSLRNNDVHEQLSWACDGKVTHTILVWHIATAICKIKLDAAMAKKGSCLSTCCAYIYACTSTTRLEDAPLSESNKKTLELSELASTMSQYCAYLIAFAPGLLPDHSFDSTSMLDRSIEDVSELLASLRGAKTMEAKCEEWMNMNNTNDHDVRPVTQGVRLARQLTNKIEDVALQWKVLSDFWAEMMLYIAPCDDAQARAHLDALARGGEFITHLWTLLTHAGVLERDHDGPMSAV